MSLRRLAMVTRIPLPMLVGEAVQGLNSSGNVEIMAFDDMIKQIQHRFLYAPMRKLFDAIGVGKFDFKLNFRDNTTEILQQEQQILQNALLMQDFGMDMDQISKYLEKYKTKFGIDF